MSGVVKKSMRKRATTSTKKEIVAAERGRVDKVIKAAGEREAEDKVERYLTRHPDHRIEVFIKGKLLGYVSNVPPKKRNIP